MDCERHNLLKPGETPQLPYVRKVLADTRGPIVAATDYMKLYADQIRTYLPQGRGYRVLGTDGFGRSDFRAKLREHFEVDRRFVAIAALRALADEGELPLQTVAEAIRKYGIDPDKPNPHHA